MLSKSLIQFSVDGQSCVPFLLFTWGQTMVEVMKKMLTSLKMSHHVLLQSMLPTLQQATTNPCLCWRLLDTHRQVSWGSLFLSPGSWCTRFHCAPHESISQSYVNSGRSMVELMVTASKRTYAIRTPRAPVPVADHCQHVPPQETLKHSSVSVSVGSLGPGAHKVCLNPLSISGRNGV